MSVTSDIKNIYTDNELNNLRMEEFSYNMMAIMKECKQPGLNMIKKVLFNVKLFDYLVETQKFWKNEYETRKLDLSTKNKLFEYKDTAEYFPAAENFPADKYLKLLGYCCSYKTKSGKLCIKHPVNGICAHHKEYDEKLKVNVTTNLSLIKNLQDIVINYIR